MKESYKEELAIHLVLKPYADDGNIVGVASVRGSVGQLLSSEILTFACRSCQGEGNIRTEIGATHLTIDNGWYGFRNCDASRNQGLDSRPRIELHANQRPSLIQLCCQPNGNESGQCNSERRHWSKTWWIVLCFCRSDEQRDDVVRRPDRIHLSRFSHAPI